MAWGGQSVISTYRDHTEIHFDVSRIERRTCLTLAVPTGFTLHRRVHLSISSIRFITPFGLIYLYCYIHDLLKRGVEEIVVILPHDASVRNYISRVHFPRCFEDSDVAFAPEILVVERELPPGQLVEATVFEVANDDEVERLAEELLELILSREPAMTSELKERLQLSLWELLSNIEVHSDVTHGIVAAQRYGSGENSRVHIAFGDSGVGIPAKLGRPEEADATTIERAIQEGVTSRPGGSGGYGLYELAEAIRRGGRSMALRSGTGDVLVEPAVVRPINYCSAVPGTLVEMIW